jgi:mannose-6-phosphate isomerase
MADLYEALSMHNCSGDIEKTNIIETIRREIGQAGYKIVDEDITKPWGAYLRFDSNQAEAFINEFFPGLSLNEARLGNSNAELSPKILLFSPHERLSWQYHYRRAERWRFMNRGYYVRSDSDTEGDLVEAKTGDEVQFQQGERHRGGAFENYCLVAEIWQHVDASQLSNEADIVRLADDYSRN